MAKTNKNIKFKEAEPLNTNNDPITGNQTQMVDQNTPAASPIPATNEEVNQAIEPVLADPVMPNDGTEPVEDTNTEAGDIKVNPETVGMEIQIPTEQLASAVAQATGDVTPAETAPDALAAQEEDLVASQGDEAVPEAPVEAPVDEQDLAKQPVQNNEPGQVLESKELRKKVRESASSDIEDNVEGVLENIITTGVENTAEGLSNGKATINSENKENRLDIIDNGIENMTESLEESEEIEDEEDSDEEISKESETKEPEEKLDFKKLISDNDFNDSELPPAMDGDEDVEGMEDADVSVFDDIDEDEINNFMSKMDSFLKDEEPEEVADSLRTAADFIEEVTVDDEDLEDNLESEDEYESNSDYEEDESEIEEPAKLDSEEKFDFDSLLSGAYDSEYEDDEDEYDEEEDTYEDIYSDEDEEENIEESLDRVLCKFPKRKDSFTERFDNNRFNRKLSERVTKINSNTYHESGIKYPAGSEPINESLDVVEAHEKVVKARREAIANFRESISREREQADTVRNPRFNEALRNSVRMTEKGNANSKSWNNNKFYDKFEESNKLDFKTLLKNGYLG